MEFTIKGEYIQLNQVIKAAGWVGNGAEANNAIDSGQVKVNGTIEHRKRNKLVDGDRVEYNGQALVIRK